MAQELQPKQRQPGHGKDQQTVTAVDEHEALEELLLMPRRSMYDRIHELAERFASTSIGQFVIERGDRLLQVVEHTAKWSLPQDKNDLKLERPLPWISFLALIILLRLARVWCSVAALMIGNGPITAQDVVYFVQTRRRKLRSIRLHGMKVIRSREATESSVASTSGQHNAGLVAKLKQLLSSAICRPGQHREASRRIFVHRVQVAAEDRSPQEQAAKRPRDEEPVDQNLTFSELLTKYANENSDDDSDFIPPPEDDANADDSTSSGTNGDSACDSDSNAEDQEHETNMEIPRIEEPTPQQPSLVEPHQTSSQLDNSVQHIGGGPRRMPKPIIDIKKEKLSDVDSGSEQLLTPLGNGPSNGAEKESRDTDFALTVASAVMSNNNNKSSGLYGREQERRGTPGHESVANLKIQMAASAGLNHYNNNI